MRVKSLGFAEVKGTAILPRERIRVGPSGVAGDRRFAAVEAGGGAVLRTVRNPALLAVCAPGATGPRWNWGSRTRRA